MPLPPFTGKLAPGLADYTYLLPELLVATGYMPKSVLAAVFGTLYLTELKSFPDLAPVSLK